MWTYVNSLASALCGPCCPVMEFYELILGIMQKWVLLDSGGNSNTSINLKQWWIVIKHGGERDRTEDWARDSTTCIGAFPNDWEKDAKQWAFISKCMSVLRKLQGKVPHPVMVTAGDRWSWGSLRLNLKSRVGVTQVMWWRDGKKEYSRKSRS